MSLDRTNVTVASRIMLPTYVMVDGLFGIVFVLDPGQRLQAAPALTPARALLPTAVWGGLWLAIAMVMAIALLRRDRKTFTLALSLNAVAWLSWGCLVQAAVFTQSAVTYLAFVPPWGWAVANIASMASLLRQETQ